MPQFSCHLVQASNIKKNQWLLQREVEKEECKLGLTENKNELNMETAGIPGERRTRNLNMLNAIVCLLSFFPLPLSFMKSYILWMLDSYWIHSLQAFSILWWHFYFMDYLGI